MYAGHIKTLNINRNGINGRKEDKTDTRLLLMPFTMDETSLIGQLNFSLSADLSHLMFSTRQKLVQ